MNLYVYVLQNPLRYMDPIGNAAVEATMQVPNSSNWVLVESREFRSNQIGRGNFVDEVYLNEQGQFLFSHIRRDEYSTVIKNTYFRGDGIYDHCETKVYGAASEELMYYEVDGVFKGYADKTYSYTIAGTDNLEKKQDFVKLNLGKVTIDEYNGGLGFREESRGVEMKLEVLPLDNPKNLFGVSVGIELNEGVQRSGAYVENDFSEEIGVGSCGFGAQASLAEANVHARIRLGKLNVYGNIGTEMFGNGLMVEASFLDKRSDGTFHILSAEGVVQLIFGINVNVYISE